VDGVQKAMPGQPVRPVALRDSAAVAGDSAQAQTPRGGAQ
jgi:hypothetical protein